MLLLLRLHGLVFVIRFVMSRDLPKILGFDIIIIVLLFIIMVMLLRLLPLVVLHLSVLLSIDEGGRLRLNLQV